MIESKRDCQISCAFGCTMISIPASIHKGETVSFLTKNIVDAFQAYAPKVLGGKRSRKWPKVARAHKKAFPKCEYCWGRKQLQTHHISDYSTSPALELKWSNLMTLCMKNKCHFLEGHLQNWKSINPNINSDCVIHRAKVANRRQ